ncbi:PQQ-binding-like beta-propeller repeat protein [Halobaculum sp. MBLA0147]|uniref:outer membrane protein assembly factor BamB family protein n=1 Tax=Halobaculum sp. MBLA0147 TaxID=3079934 RepID=UPI003523DD3D
MDSLWTTTLDARVVRIEPYDEAGVVVVTTDDDWLHCLDATSGHRRWTTEATRVGDVDETAVYLYSDGIVLALDAQTGDRLWRYVDAQDVTDVVTTGEVVGVRTYESGTDLDGDHFTVLDAESGSELASTVDDCRSSFEADGELYLVTYDEVQRYEPTRGLVTLSVPGDSGTVGPIETDVSNLYLGYAAVQTGTVAIDKQTGVQRFQTGGYTNDICLADTTLFTAMGTGDESAAVDVETGNELWTLDDGEDFTHHVDTDDDTAYFETDISGESTARITAVSREWGTRQWTWETDAASGVTVADGTVLVETDGVVALDAESGDQRWHSETMGRLEVVHDEVYVLDNQRLHRLDPGSGGAGWAVPADKWAADTHVYTVSDDSVTAYTDTETAPQSTETAVFDATDDGSSAGGGDTEVFETGETTGPEIAYCPACGADLDGFPNAQFCPQCGTDIDG